MSSSAGANGTTTIFLTFAIIILLVISRIFRNMRGVKVSEGRTIGYIIFYFAFGGFFISSSFFEGVSYFYAIPDVGMMMLAAYLSYKFADRRITFWKGSDGSIWYKGGVIIYLIYVIALIARLSVDFLVIGPSAFSFSFNGTLSQTALLGTTITDLLLAFGIGLLVGRNVRVYRRYKLIMAGKESPASVA
jgi:hypothetical protein